MFTSRDTSRELSRHMVISRRSTGLASVSVVVTLFVNVSYASCIGSGSVPLVGVVLGDHRGLLTGVPNGVENADSVSIVPVCP